MGKSAKREDADLPEWDTPGTPVDPAYTNLPAWQCDELRAENEQLRAALKIHHELGLWSLGHEACPECGQAC